MRILILTDSMDAGGAETHVLTLAKGLREKGHVVIVASGGGRAAEELKRMGIKHVELPLASHCPTLAADSYFRLCIICRRARIDIIHAHARMAAFIGARVAHKLSIAFVTTAHARFALTPLRKLFSRWGTLCGAVSEDIKQYVCESYGVSPDNIRVIENGIDTRLFSPAKNRSGEGIRLVFMSRMDTDCSKAALMLCEIAPELHARFPDLSITLAGGGELLEKVKARARRARGCGMGIHVLGQVSDVPALLREADIFVGVSRAALEAMSCGVPTVIAGDEGFFGIVDEYNFNDAKNDNFCARAYTNLTTNELFDSICRLCAMDELSRLSLGKRLREKVILSNSAERMVEKTIALYRDALKRVPCKRADIVLCGYYGCGNTGDDALLRGAIARAGECYPKYSVCALTARGRGDNERFGIKCVKRKSLLPGLYTVSRAKIFVFGGGTLLQDHTSKRSLIYYLFLLRYAQHHGVKCELWGNGIGPLRVRLLRLLTARALGGCAYIGVRDTRSGLCIHALTGGNCVRPVVESDLAVAIGASSDARVSFLLKRLGLGESRPFAVVALRGKNFIKMSREERRELSRLLNTLKKIKTSGIEILFVELCPREDSLLTERIRGAFGGIVVRGLSPSDLIGVFSKAKIVCASRYHALIFAHLAGTPFIPFGTDPKLTAMKNSTGVVRAFP